MTDRPNETERSMAFAKAALDQIRSFSQSAAPRNFEIWYHYTAASNPALNKAIDDVLARDGGLSEADLERIYETFVSPIRPGSRVDELGLGIVGGIDDIKQLIAAALMATTTYNQSLVGATTRLAEADTQQAVIRVVETLASSTRQLQHANKALESRLGSSKEQIAVLQESVEAIRAESLTDALTGMNNRKAFDRAYSEAIRNAVDRNESLPLLMLDIDHFKTFNDKYGHLTGDQVLRLVAMALKHTVKGLDIAARYGGEEFVVLLPDTSLTQALTVANHIRRAVMAQDLKKKSTGELLGRVTISIGVAMLRTADDGHSLIERADACLYAAKRNGRNRVVSELDPEYLSEVKTRVA